MKRVEKLFLFLFTLHTKKETKYIQIKLLLPFLQIFRYEKYCRLFLSISSVPLSFLSFKEHKRFPYTNDWHSICSLHNFSHSFRVIPVLRPTAPPWSLTRPFNFLKLHSATLQYIPNYTIKYS